MWYKVGCNTSIPSFLSIKISLSFDLQEPLLPLGRIDISEAQSIATKTQTPISALYTIPNTNLLKPFIIQSPTVHSTLSLTISTQPQYMAIYLSTDFIPTYICSILPFVVLYPLKNPSRRT